MNERMAQIADGSASFQLLSTSEGLHTNFRLGPNSSKTY